MSVLVQDCSKSLHTWKSWSLDGVLWLFQSAVTAVASEQGLSTSRLNREMAPKVGTPGSMLVLGDTMGQECWQFSQVKFT